jgi:hypothetical protein
MPHAARTAAVVFGKALTVASLRFVVFAIVAVALPLARGDAQCTHARATNALQIPGVRAVGTAADDSMRIGTLLGTCWGNASLIRSSLSLTPATDEPRVKVTPVDPLIASTWNSRLPVSLNDGALWAGRGFNVAVAAGARFTYRKARLTLAPQIVTSQNRPFPIIASPDPQKSPFSSPWQAGPVYADLPLRFGALPYTRVDFGESAAELTWRAVSVAATTAPQWWGPGIRNALVMSNNAAGIPRVELRTARPIPTRFGQIEAQWMIGGLGESPFFDRDERNNLRSISAAIATLRLSVDTGLTVGAARAAYANVRRLGRLPARVADVFTDWHRAPLDGPVEKQSDQVLSVFARWVFPDAGVAAHLEWAKLQIPRSIRDLFVEPQASQGFTVGAEWAHTFGVASTIRVQFEATTLEQTPETVGGITPEFYGSHSVAQGFTQQGQSIGAAIGPGGSAQFIGGGLLHRAWKFEANLGRNRWQENAYYRAPSQGRFAWRTHDVSLFAGLGAARDWSWAQVEASVQRSVRMNYLFQTPNAFLPENTTFDITNSMVSLRVVPHLQRVR